MTFTIVYGCVQCCRPEQAVKGTEIVADQSLVPASNTWLNFASYSVQDGEVDAEELQRCLTQSGFTGSYSRKCKDSITSNVFIRTLAV